MKIDAVVIGLGHMGCGYDLSRPPTAMPLTHVGGISRHPRFHLAGIADTDAERVAICERRWSCPRSLSHPLDLLRQVRAKVVTLATPSNVRAELVRAAIESGARLIFCEKPLALTLDEAVEINEMCGANDIELVVNFSRRWEVGCRKVAELVRNGGIGKIQRVFGCYSRGISNNGAHLIDLIRWWVGEISNIAVGAEVVVDAKDYNFVAGTAQVSVHGIDGSQYEMFRLELIGSRGSIQLDDFGTTISWRQAVPLDIDSRLRVLGAPKPIETDADATMMNALDDIAKFFDVGEPPACSGNEGVEAARVCSEMEHLARA